MSSTAQHSFLSHGSSMLSSTASNEELNY